MGKREGKKVGLLSKVLVLLSMVLVGELHAQILDNRECKTFTEDPFFGIKFIQRNKVKEIVGRVSIKKKLQVMFDKHTSYHYQFNSLGQMSTQFKSYPFLDGRDTITVLYDYSPVGELIVKRNVDRTGFYARSFVYDDQGRKITEMYSRYGFLSSAVPSMDSVGKQYDISEGYFQYERVDDRNIKKIYLNNYEKVYKYEMFTYNEFDYLMEQRTTTAIGRNESWIKYTYNDGGWVSSKEEHYPVAGGYTMRYVYQYDEIGNLIEEDVYRNGEQTYHIEYLYDAQMLLDAKLTQDLQSENIEIIKFTYTFYE